MRKRWLSCVVGAMGIGAIVSFSGSARAQSPSLYLDRLFMAGAPDDAIGLWRPQMGQTTRFYGQLGLGLSVAPFRVENMLTNPTQASRFSQRHGRPLDEQVIAYGDVGVEILDRLGLQVEFPFIVGQSGDQTNDSAVTGANDAVDTRLAAPMDLRLDARLIAFRNETRTFKFGLTGAAWVPTGNADSWGGDGQSSAAAGIALEFDPKKFFVTLNTGVHFRPDRHVNDFKAGSEWTWGLGAFVPLRDGKLRLGAELFGSTGIVSGTVFTGNNTPLEWMAEGRIALDEKKRGYFGLGGGTRLTTGYAPTVRGVLVLGYSFGIGDTNPNAPGKKWHADRWGQKAGDADHDGIPDDIDLCPNDPEDHKPPNPDDGCPALPDRDGDGIPDVSDKCPDQPEDFDHIDDQDGCPEDDADQDGVPDAQDACPKEPGEPNAQDPSKNGCPQFIRHISGSSEIQILQQVQFQTGSAIIRPDSYKILDEIVRLLKVNPDIKHVSVEGHTDNRGSDELNERLSKSRAQSCVDYLVQHGIEAGRLSSAGFGPKKPIASNDTDDGRQKNRRTEFHIVDQPINAQPPTPPK